MTWRALPFLLALALPALAAPSTDQLELTSPTLARGEPFQEDDERVFEIQGHLLQAAARIGGRAEHGVNVVTANELGYFLFDDNDQLVGAAIARRTRRGVSVRVHHVKTSAEAAARALVGKRVTQVLRFGRSPQRDCRMSDLPHPCKPIVTRTLRRVVTLAEEEVGAGLVLRADRGAIRFILCIGATHSADDVLEGETGGPFGLISSELVGFPMARDASTGASLSIRCQ